MGRDFLRRRNRLPADAYRDAIQVSLTVCTADRALLFRDEVIVRPVERMLREQAVASRFEIEAYCFMPDHLHALVGSERAADVRLLVKLFKQRTGFWFARRYSGRLWQRGYYDHILRREEDARVVVEYILNNPVRKGLCDEPSQWPFSWSRWFDEP